MTLFRSIAVVLLIVTYLQTPTAFAHSSGHKAISNSQAVGLASSTVETLISRGQLKSSWANLPSDSTRIHKKSKRYFIVSVANAEEGRTLFVLMSSGGDVYDANFTGEFEQLK